MVQDGVPPTKFCRSYQPVGRLMANPIANKIQYSAEDWPERNDHGAGSGALCEIVNHGGHRGARRGQRKPHHCHNTELDRANYWKTPSHRTGKRLPRAFTKRSSAVMSSVLLATARAT